MTERINLWLTVLGVVLYLSQPVVTARDTYRLEPPKVAQYIFEN